ncbi:MAG TPA: hypothetical protein VGN55_15880 [Xanthobacteraceae bacterium]|jgi:hypothetical protein
MKLYNLARMTSATAGTGTLTLGVAVSGYLTFALAGVADGDVVLYGIKDGASSEVGWGTYTASGTTLSRNVYKSTNSNALISCSGSQEVYITALGADGGDLIPGTSNPMRGFDTPINLRVNASVASNILTVALKGNNGNDPSNTNPILIPFRDPTIANGDPVWRAITAAITVDTNAVGATLGTANTVPFNLWLVAFDDAGTIKLALWQSVTGGATPTAVDGLDEGNVDTSVAFTSGATSAATFYSQNGVAVASSKAFRVLARLEYGSGLTTAGTYASAPTRIVLAHPGMKRPGDVCQSLHMTTTSGTTVTASTTLTSTNATKAIAPTSAANLVLATYSGTLLNGSASAGGTISKCFLVRGSTTLTSQKSNDIGNSIALQVGATTATATVPISDTVLDAPQTTASTTYTVKIQNSNSAASGQTTFLGNTNDVGSLHLREIQT